MNNFRVHTGYNSLGKSKWKKFEDLTSALEYVNKVSVKLNKVLTIERIPPRLTRKDKDEVMAGLGLTKVTVNGKVFYE